MLLCKVAVEGGEVNKRKKQNPSERKRNTKRKETRQSSTTIIDRGTGENNVYPTTLAWEHRERKQTQEQKKTSKQGNKTVKQLFVSVGSCLTFLFVSGEQGLPYDGYPAPDPQAAISSWPGNSYRPNGAPACSPPAPSSTPRT